jgi:hypothetical protein
MDAEGRGERDLTEREKATLDAFLTGTGYLVSGRRVDPKSVLVFRGPEEPLTDSRGAHLVPSEAAACLQVLKCWDGWGLHRWLEEPLTSARIKLEPFEMEQEPPKPIFLSRAEYEALGFVFSVEGAAMLDEINAERDEGQS